MNVSGLDPVQTVQLIILVIFLLGLLGIGFAATRLDASLEEYFLADRGLGAWVSALSSVTSSESGWITLGAVGMGYANGLSAAWFIPGCLLGYCVNWYLIAPRIRTISRERSLITLPDFLEDRVNDPSSSIRLVSVFIIFVAMTAYIGAQFDASGKLFASLFFDGSTTGKRVGIMVGALITIIYTLFGGFRASSWTDFVQGFIMIFGLALFPIYLFFKVGGVSGFLEKLRQEPVRGWASYTVTYTSPDRQQTKDSKTFRLTSTDRTHRISVDPLGQIRKSEEIKTQHPNVPQFIVQTVANTKQWTEENTSLHYEVRLEKAKSIEIRSLPDKDDPGDPESKNTETINAPFRLSQDRVYQIGRHLTLKLKDSGQMNAGGDLVDPFGKHNNPPNSSASQAKSGSERPWIPIPASLGFVIGLLGIGLGYPGMPHVLSRYMATKDDREIRTARVIAIIWGVLAFYGAVMIGMMARIQLAPDAISDQEFAFPILATEYLPPVLSGILISAILAAIMSTADSMIIITSSAVSRDLYEKCLDPNADQKNLVIISRITVLILGVLGTFAALYNVQLIFWFVLVAWGILGASFGPAVLLGVFWKRLTCRGVLAGMLTGFSSTLIWKLFPSISQFLFGTVVYELIPGFLLATVTTVLVSLVTTPPSDARDRMCL